MGLRTLFSSCQRGVTRDSEAGCNMAGADLRDERRRHFGIPAAHQMPPLGMEGPRFPELRLGCLFKERSDKYAP